MAESISVSSRFIATSKPLKTSTSPSQAYILSIVSLLGQYYAASTSSPSNEINILDKSTLKLIQTLPGHRIATTALKAVTKIGESQKSFLVSSGKDGTVIVWDDRTCSAGITLTKAGNNQPLLCFDASRDGMTVAAGTELRGEDALIHYWDPRKPSLPLRTHSSTHSDDITTLSFCSLTSDKILLSGSSDGLITVSNAGEDDEDDAIMHVANWGRSISQAGWLQNLTGQRQANIWAASDMETFGTWTSELDTLLSTDIRNPSVHSHGWTWVTDYLITCVPETASQATGSPNLGVFVGSNEGDAALLSHSDLTTASAPWYIHKQWSNGHVGIVRALLWDEEHNVLVTGGEDGKVNVWSGLNGSDDVGVEFSGFVSPRKREMDVEDEEYGMH